MTQSNSDREYANLRARAREHVSEELLSMTEHLSAIAELASRPELIDEVRRVTRMSRRGAEGLTDAVLEGLACTAIREFLDDPRLEAARELVRRTPSLPPQFGDDAGVTTPAELMRAIKEERPTFWRCLFAMLTLKHALDPRECDRGEPCSA